MESRFIVLEGMDGTGKTTQALRLLDKLQSLGHATEHFREPGTTEAGEALRQFLLSPGRPELSPESEALLFFAARRELLEHKVGPALTAGRWVVCERFSPSTLAYQGLNERLRAFVLQLHDLVTQALPQPNHTLILDLPAAEAHARTQERGELDGFEERGLSFQEQVRSGYLAWHRAHPDSTHVLDVRKKSPDQVSEMIWSCLGLESAKS